MKSEIFSLAISNRCQIKFIYEMKEIVLDPYFISRESTGKKVIYGRTFNSNEIKKFEYEQIANIKVFNSVKFSPIIPILARAV